MVSKSHTRLVLLPAACLACCLAFCLATCLTSTASAQQPQQQPYSPQPGGSSAPPNTYPNQQQPQWQQQQPQQPEQPWNQSATTDMLDRSERSDSGRGLSWVYLDGEAGYEYVGLEAISSSGLTYGDIGPSASGFVAGAGAGVRLLMFTVGARFRAGMFEDFRLYTVGAEGGLRFPLGSFEPFVTLGANYAFLGSLSEDTWGGDTSIRGFGANLGAGIDGYLSSIFSIGLRLSGDILVLSRTAVTTDPSSTSAQALAASKAGTGSGVGAAFTSTLVLGLHF